MIEVEILCPKCKKKKRFLSYNSDSKEELKKARTTCFKCNTTFGVHDNITRVIRLAKYRRFMRG